MGDIMKTDLYGLLQLEPTASTKEIKKAYRKKALTCHPDKNPDNPKAAELFQELSKALEILTDAAARAAYDRVLKAKKETETRHRELDSKRRKLKEELEAREQASREEKVTTEDAEERLQKEIERLRKEGSKLLEEERELLRQQIEKEKERLLQKMEELPRLKVTWKSKKGDEINDTYDSDKLMALFSKYGDVNALVMGKKGASALVEFKSPIAAQTAWELERGDSSNPLQWTWIQGKPQEQHQKTSSTVAAPQVGGESISSRDYESLVLMRLRQAEERKRLIQQMMEDDQ